MFLRELGASFAVMDIVRGSPSIYLTWPGYDEVAHHSGPWTEDAFKDLARYDNVLQRIRHTIKNEAPVHYDMIVLSDHGQSFGPTFLMRYDLTLKQFIELHLPEGTTVEVSMGGDTGTMGISQATAELANVQSKDGGSSTAKTLAKQGKKLTKEDSAKERARIAAQATQADVTAYGSGNLAQVYFNLFDRKITMPELEAAYPGMVGSLLAHEGIGLVCGYLDDGTPMALGKEGVRNLHTGTVEGVDPMLMYAPKEGHGASTVEIRAWQTRRVMDFPHAGDLMVISTVYEDGTVAALEELIGNHGGMGGEQTDAFIFHPRDMDVSATRNSIDVFHILNDRRGAPLPPPEPVEEAVDTEDWKLSNLLKGLGMVKVWLEHVFRCLIPDREAFKGVVDDPLMTGPALLVGIVGTTLITLAMQNTTVSNAVLIPFRLVGFFVATVVIFGAGFLLTRKGSFARTMRAVGFAQSPTVLLVFALYQPLAHIVVLIVIAMTLIGVWMGTAEAHDTKGWKTAVLPFIYLILYVVGTAALLVILGGAAVTLASILEAMGIAVPQLPPLPQ